MFGISSSKKRGVIYVVVDERRSFKEALFSIRTFKKHCPDIPVTVFAGRDRPFRESGADQVVRIREDLHPFQNKVKYFFETPYRRTLFLDADTQTIAPVRELFDCLEDCDLAVARAPVKDSSVRPYRFAGYEALKYNTGLIVFRKNDAVRKFWKIWKIRTLRQDPAALSPSGLSDQTFFNRLIRRGVHRECGMRIKTLPNTVYNVHWCMLRTLGSKGLLPEAKIFHAHWLYRAKAEKLLRPGALRRENG